MAGGLIMKKLNILLIPTQVVILFLIISLKVYSQDAGEFRPTQPPRIPVTDYDSGSHRIFDFLYMHYSFEDFTLDGFGLGHNYVDMYEQAAYNIGVGFLYMEGSSNSLPEDLDVYVATLPINGNIGYRIHGTRETNNIMIFGGIHWMYMWFEAIYGDYDIYAYGPAFGPMGGLKAEFKVTPAVSIIPYYVFHHTIFDITVEFEGNKQNVDIDPVTSNLIGFDIKIGAFSIGALLDAFNNTDNDKITILFSYDLDYRSGDEDLNRGNLPTEDKKQRIKKSAGKQDNVKQIQ